MSVLAGRGAVMLPFIGPEMFEWLLTWGAQTEDLSTSEELAAELHQDCGNDEATVKQQRRGRNHGRRLKWKEY
jgi:hypothetical protein